MAESASPAAPAIDSSSLEVFEGRAIGSRLRLHVRGAGASTSDHPAAAAWTEVCAEFDAVDRALSRFRDDSELTALNRLAGTSAVVQVSWRLREALATMHRAGTITGGRFDASVVDVLERLGEHGADTARPDPRVGGPPADGLAAGLERPRAARVPERPVDTGGIGKGLALRWAARRAVGVLPEASGLLLEAGGDVVVAGESPAGGWQVGVEDPAGSSDTEPVAVVAVTDGAIATSSVRVRNWTSPDGRAVHHLIDPLTREPARTGLLAVSVAGPDPAWAEVWTKVLFLAGREAIAAEARSRGLAAWWVTDDGHVGMTPSARQQSVWVAESRQG